MDRTDEQLLEAVADLHGIPEGSFNIRKNGKLLARNSDADIEIVSKKDKDGIDIIVRPGVKNKSVHIFGIPSITISSSEKTPMSPS